MKKTTIFFLRFVIGLSAAVALTTTTYAQQTTKSAKPAEVHVRVIERSGDNVTEIERTYRAEGMTDEKRDELVKSLVDSLKTARKGDIRQRQMTIIIDDNAGDRIVTRERSRALPRPVGPGARNRSYQRDLLGPDGTVDSNMKIDLDSLHVRLNGMADRMNRYNFNFQKDFQMKLTEPFNAWSREFNTKASTVRGLEAYPNNPDRNLLNVRFTAPAKGDVSILVTNPKGKEVARKEIKDFSGEYVGQIDLGKNASGTYFITVTQNEDGAVKRIVVQ